MDKITVLDTTLRDGEQTPGVRMNTTEKVEIARRLEILGVDVIEAGFPASSKGEREAVQAIAGSSSAGVAALARANRRDVELAWEAVRLAEKPRIHVFIATSELHMAAKLKMTRAEVLGAIEESVSFASSLCGDVEFSAEDATRSDPDFLQEALLLAVSAGAATANIADTVGYAMPGEFMAFVSRYAKAVGDRAVIGVHCHNDLGLAGANTLAAIQAGARHIEATINGIGERAGNCPLEEVIMALETRRDYFRVETGIRTKAIYRTAQRVAKISGIPLPAVKAVVGDNVFTHESGIHQHGVLSNPLTYEIMTPQSIGKGESTFLLGKLSGRHAVAERLASLGYRLADERLDRAFDDFKALAEKKKIITDEDLEAIVSNQLIDSKACYTLETFQIQSSNKLKSMACITLSHNGIQTTEAATGSGPVDAAYNAIMRIVGGEWPLASYSLKAVTEGMDALGEVTLRVSHDGRLNPGRGVSTDIIEASVLAYVNAINRALALRNIDAALGK
jgi:2-isopropylmalate synthase